MPAIVTDDFDGLAAPRASNRYPTSVVIFVEYSRFVRGIVQVFV
jgi:hypothetical protein